MAAEHHFDGSFVDGDWLRTSRAVRSEVRSAAAGEIVGSYCRATTDDVNAAVAAARRAFDAPGGWAHWSRHERADALEDLARELDGVADDLARLVTLQNGMPYSLSRRSEGVAGAGLLRFYAAMIRDRSMEELRTGATGRTVIVRGEPIGVVAAITPWNFPQGIAFTKLAPALAAGCAVVLKPAEETALDALVLASAVARSRIPAGVVNIVTGGRDIGAHLVSHPGVDKVAFTGSTAAGREIAVSCAALLRPVSLELGGKSAAIVLDDADICDLGDNFRDATMRNNGQTCHISTRILVPAARYNHYVDQVTDVIGSQRVGDPLLPETQVGPLVSAVQRDRVEGYISMARNDGARATTGGARPDAMDAGWFMSPTVFRDVCNDDAIAREEVFGPVLCVIPYGDLEDAVRLANDNAYGLGGTVWSADDERAAAVARRVDTGTIGINGYRSDPVAPFGGVKASGLGRELGVEGLRSYLNLKSIFPRP